MGFEHDCFDCAFKHLSRALVFCRLRDGTPEPVDAFEATPDFLNVDGLLQFALGLLQEMEEPEYRNVNHLAYFVGACSVLETIAWRMGDVDVRIALRHIRDEVYVHVGVNDIDEEIIETARNELTHLGQVITYLSHPIIDEVTQGVIVADLLHAVEHLADTVIAEQHSEECYELGRISCSVDDIKAMLALVHETLHPEVEIEEVQLGRALG